MILAGHFVLSQRWPSWLVAAGALLALAGWAGLLRLSRRWGPGRGAQARDAALLGLRLAVGGAGTWLAMQALARGLLLTTPWPLWPMALLTVAAVEALVWLYALERRIVARRTGLALTALRVGLLALVVLMLVQPVLASVFTQTRRRTVAVLLDNSASMRIPDRHMPAHEKLRLAEALGLRAARRPFRLEESADALRAVREGLTGELDRLDRLAKPGARVAAPLLRELRKGLHPKLQAWSQQLGKQVAPLEEVLAAVPKLPQSLKASLLHTKATLSQEVAQRLTEAAGWTHPKAADKLPGNLPRLRDALRRAAAGLAKAEAAARRAGRDVDDLLYGLLGESDRAQVDALAAHSRLDLAAAVLRRAPTDPDAGENARSLLEELSERYNVKVYTFAGAPVEADVGSWPDPLAGATTVPAASQAADPPAESMRTDLAAAMKKLLAECGDLAGVLALTDGQDNGRESPEPLARQLGARGAGFWAAAMGCEAPPADAGIIGVDSPDTVSLGDKMYADVELKLDGLKGRKVRVTLGEGKQIVDSQEVAVPTQTFRTRLQLGEEPKRPGLHRYRLEVAPEPGGRPVQEVFAANNACELVVAVTEAKTKVLLVESRPRWEYRYLKNLFTGRDKSVRLQHILTHPDTFYGQPPAKPVPASTTRGEGQEEATALPATEEEWLKFDLIVLGDVSPEDLAGRLVPEARRAPGKSPVGEVARILRKFVSDRGGTLVLIAGGRAMPARFAGTELAELIPLRLRGDETPAVPREGVRIVLTDAGAEHVICRQDVDDERSLEIWQSLPAIHWHSRHLEATPAAVVLAYALSPKPPKWLTEDPPDTDPDLARRRREYQRTRALIAVAPHGLGKVLMLTFDRTWRLRYRVGDVRHHRFWGQVLRWATAGKLPAGTDLVRLGADKTRYGPDERPIVRAKMVRKDFSPVVSRQVAVRIYAGRKLLGRTPMSYVDDSPGLYTARLEPLGPGAYRIELDSPAAAELLGPEAEKVSVEISVAPAAPAEQIELAANTGLLARLAQLSRGGSVVPAWKARQVLEQLPPGTVQEQHRREFRLWDSWVLLALFCAAATAEWVLRKRAGLT